MSRYQKGKTSLDFTEARDSEWQWHQLGHMQVCTSLQTDNHAAPHHSLFSDRMPFLPHNKQRQSTCRVMCVDLWRVSLRSHSVGAVYIRAATVRVGACSGHGQHTGEGRAPVTACHLYHRRLHAHGQMYDTHVASLECT